VFKSFFLGGFEGAVGINRRRKWFDGFSLTLHDQFLEEDYALLTSRNIFTVRESLRWPLVDKGGCFDFSTVEALIGAGRRAGITTIYNLLHFGYPLHLNILSDEFPKRFAEYCYQAARLISSQTEGVCYFTPVNEPSYLAWAAGEVGVFSPHLTQRGSDLKIALVRAAIQGTEAIWAGCPNARIISVDPFCRVVPSTAADEDGRAFDFNTRVVFESWDMIAGRVMPELGGSLRHLDIIGINYYWNNQWILDEARTPLPLDDVRRVPVRHIIRTVWNRYGREIVLSETSQVGPMRQQWMRELVDEVEAVRTLQIPMTGICWYPVLEMAEWHSPGEWTQMGLWDLDHGGGSMRRVPYQPVLDALHEAQERLDIRNDFAERSFSCESW
jgi:hypothetical protein